MRHILWIFRKSCFINKFQSHEDEDGHNPKIIAIDSFEQFWTVAISDNNKIFVKGMIPNSKATVSDNLSVFQLIKIKKNMVAATVRAGMTQI